VPCGGNFTPRRLGASCKEMPGNQSSRLLLEKKAGPQDSDTHAVKKRSTGSTGNRRSNIIKRLDALIVRRQEKPRVPEHFTGKWCCTIHGTRLYHNSYPGSCLVKMGTKRVRIPFGGNLNRGR